MDKKISACIRCCIAYLSPIQIQVLCSSFDSYITIDDAYKYQYITEDKYEGNYSYVINNFICDELKYIKTIKYIPSRSNADLYIWKYNNILYITFSGKSSFENVLIDINMKYLIKYIKKDIFVYKNIYDHFLFVEKKITEEIKKHIDDINEINITGHSFGAGCATIAAAYYGEMYSNKQITCITFGCPRIGNKKFVKWFSKNVKTNIRIANKDDPITMIPRNFKWMHTYNDSIILPGETELCKFSSENNNITKIYKYDIPWYMRLYHILYKKNNIHLIKNHSLSVYFTKLIKSS